MSNPFADNAGIDLSSIYAASLAPLVGQPTPAGTGSGNTSQGADAGGTNPAGGTNAGGGGTTGNTTTGSIAPANTGGFGPGYPGGPQLDFSLLPRSPLPAGPGTNPSLGTPGNGSGVSNDQITQYWHQVAQGLLSGQFTPEQFAAGMRGQNPNNRPGAQDASPEANLPGSAYAGTVLQSALSPDQAAQVRYNTPELQQFLANAVAQGRGDEVGFTRTNLQNFATAGQAAGNPQDMAQAIQTARQADYAQWIYRLRASGVDTNQPGFDQATYERGMGLQPANPLTGGVYTGGGSRGTPPTTQSGTAQYGAPVTSPTPDYSSQVQASFNLPGKEVAPGYTPTPIAPAVTPVATTGAQATAKLQQYLAAQGTPSALPPIQQPSAVDPATLAKLNGYIANLSAVKNPTGAQQAELQAYKTRLSDYQSRGA